MNIIHAPYYGENAMLLTICLQGTPQGGGENWVVEPQAQWPPPRAAPEAGRSVSFNLHHHENIKFLQIILASKRRLSL
jgi:hypothetical protein